MKITAPSWNADFGQIVQSALQNRSFRLLLFPNRHLVFANGLTQAVFSRFSLYVLKLSPTVYNTLGACMFLDQIIINGITGPLL